MEENNDVKIKRITCFFKTGVEHIGPGIYKKMFENGYDTKKIMDITKEELQITGIKDKSANILDNLNKVQIIPKINCRVEVVF